jgi:hypothetical protein
MTSFNASDGLKSDASDEGKSIVEANVLTPQVKETLNPAINRLAMTIPEPPAPCAYPTDLSDIISEFAETGMKDPATRVLLERAREWQAAESSASSLAAHVSALLDHDAEDPDDVSARFLSHTFGILTS